MNTSSAPARKRERRSTSRGGDRFSRQIERRSSPTPTSQSGQAHGRIRSGAPGWCWRTCRQSRELPPTATDSVLSDKAISVSRQGPTPRATDSGGRAAPDRRRPSPRRRAARAAAAAASWRARWYGRAGARSSRRRSSRGEHGAPAAPAPRARTSPPSVAGARDRRTPGTPASPPAAPRSGDAGRSYRGRSTERSSASNWPALWAAACSGAAVDAT
jgi:hypothetical protein